MDRRHFLALPAAAAMLPGQARVQARQSPARDVVRYELGVIDGIPLGFTDATALGDAVLFSAAAEDSPDATRDGRVHRLDVRVRRSGLTVRARRDYLAAAN